MTRLYYIYPFGQNADDLTSIPNNPPVNGSMSYFAGFTDLYEQDLLTVSTALPIPRGQTNQLLYDITNNIQQYQQYGVPFWITSSDNGGTPFPYAQYALASYGGVVYESQVNSNTSTPGTDQNWVQLSGNLQGVPVGTVIDYAGALPPNGYLLCDGSAVSRSTYANLLAALLIVETGTIVNTMATITGLSDTSNMYPGMKVEGVNIPTGAAILSVDSSSQVTMTENATGGATESVFFYLWGNGDNSTTFNLPDMRRKTSIGKFGTGSATVGNKVGQTGGTETNTLIEANMPSASMTANINTTRISNVVQGASSADADILVQTPSGTPRTTTLQFPNGGIAFNIMQPTAVLNKCIKYA